MKNLELIEGTKMIAPEEVDITKVGYFDEMEYELWNTIKKYLMLFGIELENQDEPDWATVETVQDKIVQVLQEAGVNFKTKTTHKEVIYREFPVVLLDTDIESIMQVALNGSISYWCEEYSTTGKAQHRVYKELTHGGVITFTDNRTGNWWELTRDDFIGGFKQYLEKSTGADILEFIDHKLRVNLNAIDFKVADAIIQYAIFGKIKY